MVLGAAPPLQTEYGKYAVNENGDIYSDADFDYDTVG